MKWRFPSDMDWKHPLANRYWGMLRRCYDPNHRSYKTYGAEGVQVCSRWRRSFQAYCDDVLRMLKEVGYRSFLDLKKHNLQIDKDKYARFSPCIKGYYHPEYTCIVTREFNSHIKKYWRNRAATN